MGNHDEVASDKYNGPENESFDSPVSSEADDSESLVSIRGDEFEDGFDVQTHQGGELESVSGFDPSRAMASNFNLLEEHAVDHNYWNLPRSCDIEYGDVPETVCGRDDRNHITDITLVPWRMICQLIMTLQDGRQARCTGWFISPRTVMTAGHCVYSHSAGGWVKSIEVFPGMNDRLRPFGSATGTTFRSVQGWTQGSRDERVAFDYGCVILPKGSSLGSNTGWFGFAKLSDASLTNLLANNSGYPGDKAFGTQWFNAGRVGDISKRRFEYQLDTAGGQSGSPTWRFSGGKRHAIGIHAYGGCPNKSTRISKSVFENMKRWKRQGM